MSLVERLRDRAQSLVTRIQDAAAGKNAQQVLNDHGGEVVDDLVKMAEEEGGKGVDKKAAVLAMLGDLYDRVIAPIDLPGPDAIIDPALKRALLFVAGIAIDRAVARLFPKPAAA